MADSLAGDIEPAYRPRIVDTQVQRRIFGAVELPAPSGAGKLGLRGPIQPTLPMWIAITIWLRLRADPSLILLEIDLISWMSGSSPPAIWDEVRHRRR